MEVFLSKLSNAAYLISLVRSMGQAIVSSPPNSVDQSIIYQFAADKQLALKMHYEVSIIVGPLESLQTVQ